MRNSLLILGVFAALVCFENPLRRKTIRGAPIMISGWAVLLIAGFQHISNARRP